MMKQTTGRTSILRAALVSAVASAIVVASAATLITLAIGKTGPTGPVGPQGTQGAPGSRGPQGKAGTGTIELPATCLYPGVETVEVKDEYGFSTKRIDVLTCSL